MPWPHLEVVQYECLIADGGRGARVRGLVSPYL